MLQLFSLAITTRFHQMGAVYRTPVRESHDHMTYASFAIFDKIRVGVGSRSF